MNPRLSLPQSPARRLAVAGGTLALCLALVGCSTSASSQGSDAASLANQCAGAEIPLREIVPEQPAREATGPSTACLPNAGVPVVDADSTPQLPVTVTGADGVEVTIDDASRILALDVSGALAATVFALGLGDNVVGRDSSTGFPEASELPLVTRGGHDLSAEAILSLKPTVVLTDKTLGPLAVLEQLRDAGVAVLITESERRLETIDSTIAEVATALGVADAGVALAAEVAQRIDATVADIEVLAEASGERPRILFLYVRGSAGIYYLFGEESGADSLIESIGGVDIAGEIGWQGMRPVTAEALVQAAPDLVLVMSGGLESVGGAAGLVETIPALASTPAGANLRIVDMADADILSFGPRTPAVLDALARAVYAPELGATAATDSASDD